MIEGLGFCFFVLVEGNINYELADHCVTLNKTGLLYQVESLRTMNYNSQFSATTEETLKQLPRSPSEEIFDRVKNKGNGQLLARLGEGEGMSMKM